MWRLLNWSFGWDYIQWHNIADSGVARIHIGFNSEVWYWQYRITHLIGKIHTADQVVWLTCCPTKYLKDA